MRTMTLFLALTLGVTLCLTSAEAQQLKKGELSGTILSGGVSVPANSSATVLTAPATGQFILTTFCSEDTALSGNTVGPIVAEFTDEPCTFISPGFAIPQGEILTCTNNQGSPLGCSITGVLSKK